MSKHLSGRALRAPSPSVIAASVLRHVLAALLRNAGALLDALAQRLDERVDAAAHSPAPGAVEFHADAGAPEGALYVDGRLVGWIDGVTRL